MLVRNTTEEAVDRHNHGRLGNRERDLDSSRIHRFLENQTLSIKTRKDTRRPVAPPTVTEIRLSACDLVLWRVRPTRIFDLYDTPCSAQQCFVTFWGSHFRPSDLGVGWR